jgi:hypothetical protein
MRVGDTKKAIVLGAVAVVVVGVAVVRIIPLGGGAAGAQNQAPNSGQDASSDTAPNLEPKELLTAPFSHPLLAKRESPASQGGQAPELPAGAGPGSQGVSAGGFLPGPLVFSPEGEGESSQESEQAPRAEVQLRLQAIVHIGRPVAILEVGDKTIRAAEGASPMEGWKVTKVTNNSVTLAGTEGERTIRVGESFAVPAAASQQKEK